MDIAPRLADEAQVGNWREQNCCSGKIDTNNGIPALLMNYHDLKNKFKLES